MLITTHMRLWQKRSRLCHFLELRSGMRIDSLGCTWWVLSSKWSKSSQLAVATEPLVPLIRLGLYVQCSRPLFHMGLSVLATAHFLGCSASTRRSASSSTTDNRFAPSAADLHPLCAISGGSGSALPISGGPGCANEVTRRSAAGGDSLDGTRA